MYGYIITIKLSSQNAFPDGEPPSDPEVESEKKR